MIDKLVGQDILVKVLEDVEGEIRCNGKNRHEKAMLFHELGSLYGLMGQKDEQKFAWQQATELDPENKMIRASLKSLK